MAGIDKKLTDLTELTTPSDGAFIHVVEPLDISQSPDGSSYKVKKSNFGGISDAPSNGTTYGRKDAAWVPVSSTDTTADHFKGNWNASTNSPMLTNGVGQVGDNYLVTVSGTQFGINFGEDDIISYNGTTWYKYADNNQAPVLTTNTNITSSVLSTQDVAGFVAYINGLISSFSVAVNEIRTYTVTDTGQKFQLLLRGRSFGGSEPDITSSDVLELEQETTFAQSKWSFCDFISETNFSPFISSALVSGTLDVSISTSNTKDNFQGCILMQSGGSAGSGYRVTTNTNSSFGGLRSQKGLTFFGTFTLFNNGGRDNLVRIGFHTCVNSIDSTDGAYLEINSTTGTFKTANNSVRTTSAGFTIDTTTSPPNTFYSILISFVSNTSVFVKIKKDDGTVVYTDTISTNIPITSRRFGAGIVSQIMTAGSAAAITHLEYMGVGNQKPNFLKNF